MYRKKEYVLIWCLAPSVISSIHWGGGKGGDLGAYPPGVRGTTVFIFTTFSNHFHLPIYLNLLEPFNSFQSVYPGQGNCHIFVVTVVELCYYHS